MKVAELRLVHLSNQGIASAGRTTLEQVLSTLAAMQAQGLRRRPIPIGPPRLPRSTLEDARRASAAFAIVGKGPSSP